MAAVFAGLFFLTACGEGTGSVNDSGEVVVENGVVIETDDLSAFAGDGTAGDVRLLRILEDQPEDVKARYAYRHPAATLAFFGIRPGMTVIDVLPGDVWYAGILSEYLGPDGEVIGVDYATQMWPLFGEVISQEFIDSRKDWAETWTADMTAKAGENSAPFNAFRMGEMPVTMTGRADIAIMIRAAHNLYRFEDEGSYLSQALAELSIALKPGGMLGIVQHRAPAAASDAWSDGSNGYLKEDALVQFVESAGFELVRSSEINANPLDRPSESDFVWRLAPSFYGTQADSEQREAMVAIGESDRMTLLFRKKDT